MKTVVFIDNFAHNYLGGGESFILSLADKLIALNYQLIFVAQKHSAFYVEAQSYSDTVLALDFSQNIPFKLAGEIRSYVASHVQGDEIIYQGSGFYSNIIAGLAKGEHDCLVFTQQIELEDAKSAQGLSQKLNVFARRLSRKFLAPNVDRYMAVSQTLADQLSSLSFVESKKVKVLHPVLPLESYEARQDLIEPLESLKPFEDAFCIGFLGRLEEVKNVDILLEAFRRFVTKHQDKKFELFIAGEGSQKESLISQADSFGEELSGHIHFLSYVDSLRFMAGIDLFCMPSKAEGLNIAVLQAHAFKVPVIASNVGALKSTAKHKERGVLFETNSSDALFEALEYAYKNMDQMKKYAQRGYDFVLDNFNDKDFIKKVQEFYEDL